MPKKLNELPAVTSPSTTDIVAVANPTTGAMGKTTKAQLLANVPVTTGSPNQITNIWSGTQAQYDALTPVATTLYFII